MPDDRAEQSAWLDFNRLMRDAITVDDLHPLPVQNPTLLQNPAAAFAPADDDRESPLEEIIPWRAAFRPITPSLDLQAEQSRKECGAVLQALQKNRSAKNFWPKNRRYLDAPQWLGVSDAEWQGFREPEKELPQLFGINVHAHGNVSGIFQGSAGDVSGSSPWPQEARQKRQVLMFPSTSANNAVATPHCSHEGVLPFRVPVVTQPILFFSLVGGVGRTSLAAVFARVLASCGERVILADAGGHSLLPRYFGGKGSRQGVIRKFIAPPDSKTESISMLSLDIESFAWNDEELDRIHVEFQSEASAFDRVVWDLGNAPIEWSARILRQGARVIVPLLPTAKCLMQLSATESMLQKSRKLAETTRWQYVLNQFDEQDASHREIRGRFRAQLGDRLLPFVLRSTPLVNEALLCGRTVLDHAPASPLVADVWHLTRSVAGVSRTCPEIVPERWDER